MKSIFVCLVLGVFVQLQLYAAAAPAGCSSQTFDIIFMVDGSGSVDFDEFDNIKLLVKIVAAQFDLEEDNLGVAQFSHYWHSKPLHEQEFFKTEIKLGKYKSLDRFKEAVERIESDMLTTYTAHAIKKVVEYDFKQSMGLPCQKKAIVLITDDEADDDAIASEAKSMVRLNDIYMVAVGIGKGLQGDKLVDLGASKVLMFEDYEEVAPLARAVARSIKKNAK